MSKEETFDERECQAGVKNIFYQDYVLVAQGVINVLCDTHFAGRVPGEFLICAWAIAVAGNANKLESCIEVHSADQIAQKNGRAFQHANKHDRLTGGIASDLPSHVSDAGCDLIARDQNSELVHGTNILRCTHGLRIMRILKRVRLLTRMSERLLSTYETKEKSIHAAERNQTHLARTRHLSNSNAERHDDYC